jgi:hypothetical protein
MDHEEQRDDHPWQECQQKTRSGKIHGIVSFRVHIGIGPAVFSGVGCGEL